MTLPSLIKGPIKRSLAIFGYRIARLEHTTPTQPGNIPDIPDKELYTPRFSPWLGKGEFRRYYDIAAPRTLVSPGRCFVIYKLLSQAIHLPGDIWECGVYKGGTAKGTSRTHP